MLRAAACARVHLPAGQWVLLRTDEEAYGGRCASPAAGRLKHGPLGSLDRQTMALLPALRCPAGVTAARMVSALAEPGMAAAVLAAHAALRAPRDGWRAACGPAVVVASGTVARRWLSRVIAGRGRPRRAG